MKAKLTIDGKEFEVEISEEQVQALTETKKKTGYERVDEREIYYSVDETGVIDSDIESLWPEDSAYYENANYYSDESVAENNARADKLYRQLRRFAVEHRKKEIDWNDEQEKKHYIFYNYYNNTLSIDGYFKFRGFGIIYFDTKETAQLAIDTFKDELLWYFTEYKDSL